jgi:hypothetical protein
LQRGKLTALEAVALSMVAQAAVLARRAAR